jgi:hypothetical protein
VARSVDVDLFADERRIGRISPAPQPVADHDNTLVARLFLFMRKTTAVSHSNTQKREKICRDPRASQALRLAVTRQIAFPWSQNSHRGKGRLGFTPLEVGLHRHRQAWELLAALWKDDLGAVDLIGLDVRQRLQEHGVHNAENCGVRADPECEGEEHSAGESRTPSQGTEGVTDISHDAIEPLRASFIAAFLFCQIDRTKLAAGTLLRLFWVQALSHVLGNLVVEMKTQLGIHSPFPIPPCEAGVPGHRSVRGLHDQRYRFTQPVPARGFCVQPPASSFGHSVVLRLTAAVGGFPFRLEQPPILQPVKRRIERALPDLKRILGDLLDALDDAIAMNRPQRCNLQDRTDPAFDAIVCG